MTVVYNALTLFNRQTKTDTDPSINISSGIYDVVNMTSAKPLKAGGGVGVGWVGGSNRHFKLYASNDICV